MKRNVIIVSTFVALLPTGALAEVYECDGKWTNKPCTGSISRSIEETGSAAPADPAVKLVREKTSALHELRMRTVRLREEINLSFDISGVEDFCLKEPSSLEECRQKIAESQKTLDERSVAASAVSAQQRSIKLQEEANSIQRERNRIEAEKPNVAVVEERPIYVIPRDRDHHGHHDHSETNIQVTGSYPNGGISVGVGSSSGSGHDHAHSGETIIVTEPRPTPPRRGVTVHDNFGNPKHLQGVEPGPFAPKKNNSAFEGATR